MLDEKSSGDNFPVGRLGSGSRLVDVLSQEKLLPVFKLLHSARVTSGVGISLGVIPRRTSPGGRFQDRFMHICSLQH